MARPGQKPRIINHTADIGIEIEGGSLKELFLNAARGAIGLIVECRRSGVPACRGTDDRVLKKISLKADLAEGLLVRWLEELLYLFEEKRLVPVEFKIGRLLRTSLNTEVSCVPFDPKTHRIKYVIKAVTYHDLTITEEKGRFRVRIIFDI